MILLHSGANYGPNANTTTVKKKKYVNPMFPAVIQIPKKSMKERKTEEKCGRVIFSALPTPVLRFHEDKKNLIKDMC